MSQFDHAVATAHDALADLRQQERERSASQDVADHVLPLDIYDATRIDRDRVTHDEPMSGRVLRMGAQFALR